MRKIILAATVVMATLAAGCATKHTAPAQLAGGEKVTITQATWDAYINYKQWLMPKSYTGPVGDGYFAVTKDGKAWGLTGCPDNSCDLGTLDPGDAIDVCKTRNGNRPCLVFAHQEKIVIPYQIVN